MWDSVKKTANTLIASLVTGVFVSLPISAQAQTDVSLDPEFGARISVGVNKKVVKKLHVSLEEEVRFADNFSSFSRMQTTIGCSYKINNMLKAGVGYALINPYSSSNGAFKNSRHRLMADVSVGYRTGAWKFSLKERIQMTHLTGDFNTYQQPRNAVMLKSRLSAKYHLSSRLVPYTYVELRHFLNAPVITAVYDGSSYSSATGSDAAGWFLDGFNGSYLNRVRTSLGIDIPVSKQHQFNLHLLADYVSDKVVDANAKGTKLKSYTKEHGWMGWVGAGYAFKF